ncbi:MAG: hypothetical protein AB8B96_18230 [Lysobacterales bacterium]
MRGIQSFVGAVLCAAGLALSLPATSATVSTITTGQGSLDGLEVGSDGAIYVSQPNGNQVFRLADGQVETFLTGLEFPLGTVFDSSENFYVSSSRRVVQRTPDGQTTDYATGFSLAAGLVFDSSGDLFVADYNLSRIFRVTPAGAVTVFSQGDELNGPAGVAFDSQGRLYAGNFNDGKIIRFASDGGQTVIAQPDNRVGYIAIGNDTIYATLGLNRVVQISLEGEITPLAGTGQNGTEDGNAESATFLGTNGITVSPDLKTVFVSEFQSGGGVRAIELDQASTFEINQGVSGAWFYPVTTGSGLLLDVNPDSGFFFAAWFTYASDAEGADGSSRWFTASGQYQGHRVDTQLFRSSGGRFDSDMAVETVPVGSMQFEFSDCNNAVVGYALDGGASGDFPITRVIPGTEALCETLTPANLPATPAGLIW